MKYIKNDHFELEENLQKHEIKSHTKAISQKSILILMGENGIDFLKEKEDKIACIISTQEILDKINLKIKKIPIKKPRKAWANICFLNHPNLPKNIIAVTGTNGKTSITNFVSQILNNLEIPNILIGTLGIFENGKKTKALKNTTPDASIIHENVSNFAIKNRSESFCIIEATSIGIDQERTAYLPPSMGIFNNFSLDHLDYHKNEETYLENKLKLSQLSKNFLVHESIKNKIKSKNYKYYGKELKAIKYEEEKLIIELELDSKKYKLKLNLIGQFQAENILSAIIILKEYFNLKDIITAAEKIKAIPGRMEKIENCIVDFAHTSDALEKAIEESLKINKNLCVVVGCGGNRDKCKRPEFGGILNKASYAIITNDNPRFEDPMQIAKEIESEINQSTQYKIILDRKTAIKEGYNWAKENNGLCLIAGRGAEEYQKIKDENIKFSDIEYLKSILT